MILSRKHFHLEKFTTEKLFSEYFCNDLPTVQYNEYMEDIGSKTLLLTWAITNKNIETLPGNGTGQSSFYVYFRTCRTGQLEPSRSAVISYLAGHLNQSTNAGRSKPLRLLEPSNISVRSNSTDQKKDQTMAVVKKKLRKNKKNLKEATTLQNNSTRYK